VTDPGIWIWSEPSYDPEKNIYVYYMDTEGLGSTSRSSTHDSRIFALALLLSSYFIYNSRGSAPPPAPPPSPFLFLSLSLLVAV
jgi:hypothetical protein